ncbi:hypothetical protein EZS27_026296 [termite gut metagenome]|uniref:Uncharacterized protein n=1 Tax=termite gut metagenome TaxID=433724 RepID=A0A5J4QQX9_9ZZZZ
MPDYTFASVPKHSSNAGRATGKKSYIVFFRFDDIIEYERDEKGVRVTALTFAADKKPIAVYGTNSTIKVYQTSEGDDDARGYIQHLDFDHPGTAIEIEEFENNNINENLGAITFECDGADADCKIVGTPCQPLKMIKADSQDDKDAKKHTLNFATSLRGPVVGRISKTLIKVTDNAEINAILGLTVGGV